MSDKDRFRKLAQTNRGAIKRKLVGRFTYPYGAYPEKDYPNKIGYDSKYIREEGYFYYQIAVSHERLLVVFKELLDLLPGRAFVVTQIHTDDYYRESDTYISSEPASMESLKWWFDDWKDVALDDGFFGIGAFMEDPTIEVFLDEHKTMHVYHTDPDLMEGLLERLGIPFVLDLKMYWDEPHYHEPLPLIDETSEDYLTAYEDLADRYDMLYDGDDDENNDDTGEPLGMTCWKADVRGYGLGEDKFGSSQGFYSTIYLNADSRSDAVEQIEAYLDSRGEYADLFMQVARIPYELLTKDLRDQNDSPELSGVWYESERVEFDWDHPRY
jgi:hypothetical protein